MNPEIALPILIPLMAGAVSLLFWRSRLMQRLVAVGGTAALLVTGVWLLASVNREGILVMHMGGWVAPFGISLVADLLGAIMVVLTGIIGFAVAIYSLATAGRGHEAYGYFPLMHLLLAGVAGAFLTGDIFNLYVWFEVMLVASFALL
ncbi:MAG: Na+/H+ antiporter subunit D, partial [Halomonas sp.]